MRSVSASISALAVVPASQGTCGHHRHQCENKRTPPKGRCPQKSGTMVNTYYKKWTGAILTASLFSHNNVDIWVACTQPTFAVSGTRMKATGAVAAARCSMPT